MSETAPPQFQAKESTPSHSNSWLLQRKCACGGSSGITGSCSDCEKKKWLGQPLQTKLSINEPGDEYEREADRVAELVMRMPEPNLRDGYSRVSTDPLAQRRIAADGGNTQDAALIVGAALSSPGHPLDENTRAYFEPRFSHDFSSVRVHTDSGAATSAAKVGALAYTLGNDIVFAAGKYSTTTTSGKRLLAHELSHVIQQSRDSITEVVQRKPDKGRVVVKVVDTFSRPIKNAVVFLIPQLAVGIFLPVHVNAEGLAIFEKEEGVYSVIVVPESKCFPKRYIRYFYVAGNKTQGTVVRLKNYCVA
jgi:Domain of unknown function (DUF4157)